MAHAVVQEKEAFFQIIRIEISLKLTGILARPDPPLEVFNAVHLAEDVWVQALDFHRAFSGLPFYEAVHFAPEGQPALLVADLEWLALDSDADSERRQFAEDRIFYEVPALESGLQFWRRQ